MISTEDSNDTESNENQMTIRKPPDNYVCHRCHIKGHFVQNCPGVFDRKGTQFQHRSIRRPIGIPKSKLVEIDGPTEHSYLTNDGRHVVELNLYKALQQSNSSLLMPKKQKLNIEIPNKEPSPVQNSSTNQPTYFSQVSTFDNISEASPHSPKQPKRKNPSPMVFDWNNHLGAPLIQTSPDPPTQPKPVVNPQWNPCNSVSWDIISKMANINQTNQQMQALLMGQSFINPIQNSAKWMMSQQTNVSRPIPQAQVPFVPESSTGIIPPVIIDEKLTSDEKLRKFKLDYFRLLEKSVEQNSNMSHKVAAVRSHRNEPDRRYDHSGRHHIDMVRGDLPHHKDHYRQRSRSRGSKSRYRVGSFSREDRSKHRERSTSRRRYGIRRSSRSKERGSRYGERSRSRDGRRYQERSRSRHGSKSRRDVDRYRGRSRSRGDRCRSRNGNTSKYGSESWSSRREHRSRSGDRHHRDKHTYSGDRSSKYDNDKRGRLKETKKDITNERGKKQSNPDNGWFNYHDDDSIIRDVQPYSIPLNQMQPLPDFSGNSTKSSSSWKRY